MISLSYSGDSSYSSEENIKKNIFKVFMFYCFLSFALFLLFNISGIRLFNSLNISMTIISNGGFLPTDYLSNIISSNFQKIIFIFALFFSMINFYIIFNIFNKKVLIREHKEDLYLLLLTIILVIFIYFNNNSGLDLIISVISSLSNSGLTLIKSNN